MSSVAAPSVSTPPPGAPPTGGRLARAALVLAVTVTAASFVALLVILGYYFAGATPHAALYWMALWGFPVGFVLMCGYVVLGLGRRRRLGSA